MRSWVLMALVASAMLGSGCGDRSGNDDASRNRMQLLETEVIALQTENESLRTQDSLRNDIFEEYTQLINQTLEDMESLTRREGIMREIRMDIEAGERGESSPNLTTIEDRINDNLAAIEGYIRESKRQRDELQRMVEEPPEPLPQPDISRFESTIERLNSLVEQKERAITQLRLEAQELLSRIELLQEENAELFVENTELKQAFYVVGTQQALLDKGIIERSGGVLGIGRTTQLDMINPEHFTEADVEVKEIPVGTNLSRYEILSNHKANKHLYDFAERDGEVFLTLYDTYAFWQVSRYLVVAVKE